ncbi:unnamed protein product, partial [Iphiclides podalirius]
MNDTRAPKRGPKQPAWEAAASAASRLTDLSMPRQCRTSDIRRSDTSQAAFSITDRRPGEHFTTGFHEEVSGSKLGRFFGAASSRTRKPRRGVT